MKQHPCCGRFGNQLWIVANLCELGKPNCSRTPLAGQHKKVEKHGKTVQCRIQNSMVGCHVERSDNPASLRSQFNPTPSSWLVWFTKPLSKPTTVCLHGHMAIYRSHTCDSLNDSLILLSVYQLKCWFAQLRHLNLSLEKTTPRTPPKVGEKTHLQEEQRL